MVKYLLLGSISFLLIFSFAQRLNCQIIISELVDPKQDFETDRYIEIYNLGFTTVDLEGWKVVAIGNNTSIFEWQLFGEIDPHEALVIGDASPSQNFTVDYPDENWSLSNGTWNGKAGDGATLYDDLGTIIDFVVVPGSLFENQKMVRKPQISAPSTTFITTEWTSTEIEFATDSDPGYHFSILNVPVPDIEEVTQDIPFPYSGDAIEVSAKITVDTGHIQSAELRWGLSESNLDNAIEMSSLMGDDIFTVVSKIPTQSAGTRVYYEIEGETNAGGIRVSQIFLTGFPQVLTIKAVQGEVEKSPYEDIYVEVDGLVTALNESEMTIQKIPGSWNGVWAETIEGLMVADSVVVRGIVEEIGGVQTRTTLTSTVVKATKKMSNLPSSHIIKAGEVGEEQFEGVLLALDSARYFASADSQILEDKTGIATIGLAFTELSLVHGSVYEVTGVANFENDKRTLNPVDLSDAIFLYDDFPPTMVEVRAFNDIQVRLEFSEPLDVVTAENEANYHIEGFTITGATLIDSIRVVLASTPLSEQEHVVVVNGVEDRSGNPTVQDSFLFEFLDVGIPPGYYDPAEGKEGEVLRQALHDIIDDHTVKSYDFAWTAFRTTDRKLNGKVWDIYSDTPGETPPYEYDFGVDENGVGSMEGSGYNREHTWPRSWFGGDVFPMTSDLFALHPCDANVNINRSNLPYGDVDNPTYTSLNGSLRGSSDVPGYDGIVFEPIDEYKGDLARTYFYMSTRYFGEDAGWPGSPMTSGANLEPWAVAMLIRWANEDPVSQKEIDRNNAIYNIQTNRNPFIDRPEFIELIWDGSTSTEEPVYEFKALVYPNPFTNSFIEVNISDDYIIFLVSQRGRIVFNCKGGCQEDLKQTLKILPSGWYYLLGENSGEKIYQQLIKH